MKQKPMPRSPRWPARSERVLRFRGGGAILRRAGCAAEDFAARAEAKVSPLGRLPRHDQVPLRILEHEIFRVPARALRTRETSGRFPEGRQARAVAHGARAGMRAKRGLGAVAPKRESAAGAEGLSARKASPVSPAHHARAEETGA